MSLFFGSHQDSDDDEKPQIRWTSEEIRMFLKDLDESDHELTDWEARFVENNLLNPYFTPRQRQIVYELAQKYHV